MAEYYDQRDSLVGAAGITQQNWHKMMAQGENQAKEVEPDSLASIAPRVINAAIELDKISSHIEQSFGITRPSPGAGQAEQSQPPPTLMSQLRTVERLLRNATYTLENVNRHVNG